MLGRLGAILAPTPGHKTIKNYGFSHTFGLFPTSYPYPLSWALLRTTSPVLKPSWGHLGTILGRLGAILGPSWATSGPFWGHLRAQMGHLWPSWGHLGVILGDLVAIFGPFGLILGHLAVVLGRLGLSWAVLGPSWGRFGENPEPCWSAAWSFTSRLLGMECGRCYPAGVSIRPHDEVDAGTVLNPTQELPRRFPRGSPPAEAGAHLSPQICISRSLK